MRPEWISALVGGALIGISVSIMLLWNGRATGISGILYGLLRFTVGDIAWRTSFLLGLFAGGLTLWFFYPVAFSSTLPTSDWTVAWAGLLVGFGTVLGSGCTSGHGVCGISRLSARSVLATLIFIGVGVAAVAVFRWAGLLP